MALSEDVNAAIFKGPNPVESIAQGALMQHEKSYKAFLHKILYKFIVQHVE